MLSHSSVGWSIVLVAVSTAAGWLGGTMSGARGVPGAPESVAALPDPATRRVVPATEARGTPLSTSLVPPLPVTPTPLAPPLPERSCQRPVCESPTDTEAGQDPLRIFDRFRDGSEDDRLLALQDAFVRAVGFPLELLQEAMASDPSPRVRLAAFETYLDSVAGDDPESIRRALQAATHIPDDVVRQVARHRLDAFDRLEAARAIQPQGQ